MTVRSPSSKRARAGQSPALAPTPSRSVAQPLAHALMWLLTLVIITLSVVPPSLRPITAVSHKLEHIAIFMMWGTAFALCYRINCFYQIIAAVLFAGAIEVAQYWVPGRHARLSDFVVDSLAACVSLLFTRIFAGRLTTWFSRHL